MRNVRATGLAVMAIAAMGTALVPAQAHRMLATTDPMAPPPLVIESRLPPSAIIACLAKRDVRPQIVPFDYGKRVLLGPSNGQLDLLPTRGGSWMRLRTEWSTHVANERWTRGCAVGRVPKPALDDLLNGDIHWPGAKPPPNRHPG